MHASPDRSCVVVLWCALVSSACSSADPGPVDPPPPPLAPIILGLAPTSAAVGAVVTITGAHLASVTAVRFNGKPSTSLTANTEPTITAIVPVNAASGSVVVVTAGGVATSPVDCVVNVTYAAPLVITQGGTYSGAWESTDGAIPAVTVNTSEAVVIENRHRRSAGEGISSYSQHAHLTVRHCYGQELNPNVAGEAKRAFVGVGVFDSVTVE